MSNRSRRHLEEGKGARGECEKRVVGLDSVTLDKICLINYKPWTQLDARMHAVGRASFQGSSAVLHLRYFRYFDDFAERALLESTRQEHWGLGVEQVLIGDDSGKPPARSFTGTSGLFQHSDDSVKHNLIRSTAEFDRIIEIKRGQGN